MYIIKTLNLNEIKKNVKEYIFTLNFTLKPLICCAKYQYYLQKLIITSIFKIILTQI